MLFSSTVCQKQNIKCISEREVAKAYHQRKFHAWPPLSAWCTIQANGQNKNWNPPTHVEMMLKLPEDMSYLTGAPRMQYAIFPGWQKSFRLVISPHIKFAQDFRHRFIGKHGVISVPKSSHFGHIPT